jgi:hypothetical protein
VYFQDLPDLLPVIRTDNRFRQGRLACTRLASLGSEILSVTLIVFIRTFHVLHTFLEASLWQLAALLHLVLLNSRVNLLIAAGGQQYNKR